MLKILFTPLPAGKFWDGTTLYTEPLGGSESAVAFLARELAKQGHDVSVLGHMKPTQVDSRTIDMVNYYPHTHLDMLLNMEWDAVISSRWFEILSQPWKTSVPVIWLHDMPYDVTLNYRARFAVMLSEFHRDAWGLTEEDSIIIGNGVDLSYFTANGTDRKEFQLIWTSNPDRGLALAAKIFQDIRERWPKMELHVYGRAGVYGYDASVEAPYLPRPAHMENVFIHEPVKKSVLAKRLQESWAFFYPTFWPETYCIATLEAQAAGTPVIASPYGALNETVEGGVLTYDYLNAVAQLRQPGKYSKEQKQGLDFAAICSWEHRAHEWVSLIEAGLKEAWDADPSNQ